MNRCAVAAVGTLLLVACGGPTPAVTTCGGYGTLEVRGGAVSVATFDTCTLALVDPTVSVTGADAHDGARFTLHAPLAVGMFHCESGEATLTYQDSVHTTADGTPESWVAGRATAGDTHGSTCTVFVDSVTQSHWTGRVTAHMAAPLGAGQYKYMDLEATISLDE